MGDSNWSNLFKALLKARSKNQLEDIKLQKWLYDLDTQRKHADRMRFNDLYEQRKLSFQMKADAEEANERQAKEAKANSKWRKLAHKQAAQKYRVDATITEEGVAGDSSKMVSNDVQESFHARELHLVNFPKILPGSDDDNGGVVKSKDGGLNGAYRSGECNLERTNHEAEVKHNKLPSSLRHEITTRSISVPGKHKGPDNLQLPCLQRSQTVPVLRNSRSQTTPTTSPTSKASSAKSWAGDPTTIRSVRRPRKNPSELVSQNTSRTESRKLTRDMPKYPSCSRNCNRPGSEFETMVAETAVLPAISRYEIKKSASSFSILVEDKTAIDGSKKRKSISQLSLMEALITVDKIDRKLKEAKQKALIAKHDNLSRQEQLRSGAVSGQGCGTGRYSSLHSKAPTGKNRSTHGKQHRLTMTL